MNDQNNNKNSEKTDDELKRIAELKNKLQSNSFHASAVRERPLKKHNINIGQSWQETDIIQAKIEADKKRREEAEKSGVLLNGSIKQGNIVYGHYSAKDEVYKKENKNIISTALNSQAQNNPTTIRELRARETEKKFATQNVSMQYTSIYSNEVLGKNAENYNSDIETKKELDEEKYRPNFEVNTFGGEHQYDFKKEIKSISKEDRENNIYSLSNVSVADEIKEEISEEKRKRFTFGIFILIFTFIIFSSVSLYTYFHIKKEKSVIDTSKVLINVIGPTTVKSGEVNDFIIEITNTNPIELQLADIVAEYPKGTMKAYENTETLNTDRINIGNIKAGETIRKKVSAIFFGEENNKKNIRYTIEYTFPDSSSVFNTHKDIAIIMGIAPISLKITNVKEITNNQELAFDIEIISNSEEITKNIQLAIEYPFGYKIEESNIKPTFDTNIWNINEILPLEKKTISLKGKLLGTNNLEKNFKFTLGIFDIKTNQMNTILAIQDEKVIIQKPFISSQISVNGKAENMQAVNYSDHMQVSLFFKNNLTFPITDAQIKLSLKGFLFDRKKIRVEKGFYRSSDDIILFDKATDDRLAIINPNETKEISFTFSIIDSDEATIKRSRRISSDIIANIEAKRLNENSVPESLKTTNTQEFRLMTNPSFYSSLSYDDNIFENTGPFPPKVNEETTYTYTARITNTSNTYKDVVFTAKLPPNTIWKNIYSKDISEKDVLYNNSKREITLNIGDISQGAGIDMPYREFSFQLGFIPTLTESGSNPDILLSPRISGIDVFTGLRIERTLSGINLKTHGNLEDMDATVQE